MLLLPFLLVLFARQSIGAPQKGPEFYENPSFEEAQPGQEAIDSEYCPIGQPLKAASGDSFVLCGQCKPFADCPPTHFCKLDSPSKPGYCCARKAGSAAGTFRQTAPPQSTVELSKKVNESISPVLIGGLNPRTGVVLVNETETDTYDGGDYTESSISTIGANVIPPTRRPGLLRITPRVTREPDVRTTTASSIEDGGDTDQIARPALTTTAKSVTEFPTIGQAPVLASLYKTTTAISKTALRSSHTFGGEISDNALPVNWPARMAQATIGIPSRVQDKLSRRFNASTHRPTDPGQLNDGPPSFLTMLSPESESKFIKPLGHTAEQQQQTNVRWPPASPETYWSDGGRISLSSGRFHSCTSHSDCFQMREPTEWCRLAGTFEWTDRSCFCAFNATAPACVIQRRIEGVLEWTFCNSFRALDCAP